MINHTCAQCHENLQFPDPFAGQQRTCPRCGAPFTVPTDISSQPPFEHGGSGQAIASLICGVLSFFCLSILASLPAVILGHISLSKIKRGLMPVGAWGMAVAGLVLGYLNILASIAVIALLIGFAFLRTDARIHLQGDVYGAHCQNNLKQMGVVFKMWAGEHKGYYPHVSPTPGQLMAVTDEIYPEYLTDPGVLTCPAKQVPVTGPPLVDDGSYFYLGYVVTNDREVASFCKAYRERMAQGQALDQDLTVPMGEGLNQRDTIYRMKEGVERFLITDIGDPASAGRIQSTIPALIERPGNHGPRGDCNVLFMDGHVERIPYPGKWPMTKETIDALLQLDAMGK